MHPIDYPLLGKAVQYYRDNGYEYQEIAWWGDLHTMMATCPDETKIARIDEHCLVGSAEQGMIGNLSADTFVVACGPCFRLNEPDTEYHHDHFMKVELGYQTESYDSAMRAMDRMLHDARLLMGGEQEVTPVGIDLVLNGLEIGSYGIRVMDGFYHVYGTGMALPRFSQATL